MDTQINNKIIKSISIFYFAVILVYSICVYFDFQPYKTILGFSRIPILMLLYLYSSKVRNYVYFLALFFYQVASFLFNHTSEMSLILAVSASVIFRFLMVVLVYKAIEDKKWKTTLLTCLPFLFVYLYLINLVEEALGSSYYLWILNGFLTALLGGLAVTNYFNKSDRKSFWLLISALLFVVQIGMFFINKFYLKQQVFLQIIIICYGISHYTFYKFMIINEENENQAK